MSILALDLGTRTGWALHDRGKNTHGNKFHKGGRFEGGGMRFLRFERMLQDLNAKGTPITLIVYEEVRRHSGTDAAHAYGGFLATLTTWCERNNIPYSGVPVGTIKKFGTGKGNANKNLMIKAAEKMGYAPKDDNEADAIILLHYALEEFGSDYKPNEDFLL